MQKRGDEQGGRKLDEQGKQHDFYVIEEGLPESGIAYQFFPVPQADELFIGGNTVPLHQADAEGVDDGVEDKYDQKENRRQGKYEGCISVCNTSSGSKGHLGLWFGLFLLHNVFLS